jgi:hypothetical protein
VLHNAGLKRLTSDKQSSLLGPYVSCKENQVLSIWLPGLFLWHFIYFIASEWAQLDRVFYYTELKRLASGKQSSLLGPLVTYKENKVLSIWLSWLFSRHFIYIITSEWAQKASVLHNTRLKRLTNDKQPSLLGPYVSYKENKVLLIWLSGLFSRNTFS